MRVILVVAIAAVAVVFAVPAQAETLISFGAQAGKPAAETYGGTGVNIADLFGVTSGTLYFDAGSDLTRTLEDLDAGHIRSDGSILLSFDTFVFTFGGLVFIEPGDLLVWNGTTASVLFDGASNLNVDAAFERSDGKLILSFKDAGSLNGTAFDAGDLLLYDPSVPNYKPSIWFDDASLGTGLDPGQRDIDAVHVLSDTSFIFSTRLSGPGLDSFSLYKWDNGTITQFLGGSGLFSGNTRQLDAASMNSDGTGKQQQQRQGSEPATFILAGLALIAALSLRHRL